MVINFIKLDGTGHRSAALGTKLGGGTRLPTPQFFRSISFKGDDGKSSFIGRQLIFFLNDLSGIVCNKTLIIPETNKNGFLSAI